MQRLADLLVDVMRRHLVGGNPVVPEAGRDLWRIFVELSASRTYHGAGPNPIQYGEIEAWARLHRWPLEPHHIAIIRAMDDAWLEHAYVKMKAPAGNDKLAQRSSQPLSPQLFDVAVG